MQPQSLDQFKPLPSLRSRSQQTSQTSNQSLPLSPINNVPQQPQQQPQQQQSPQQYQQPSPQQQQQSQEPQQHQEHQASPQQYHHQPQQYQQQPQQASPQQYQPQQPQQPLDSSPQSVQVFQNQSPQVAQAVNPSTTPQPMIHSPHQVAPAVQSPHHQARPLIPTQSQAIPQQPSPQPLPPQQQPPPSQPPSTPQLQPKAPQLQQQSSQPSQGLNINYPHIIPSQQQTLKQGQITPQNDNNVYTIPIKLPFPLPLLIKSNQNIISLRQQLLQHQAAFTKTFVQPQQPQNQRAQHIFQIMLKSDFLSLFSSLKSLLLSPTYSKPIVDYNQYLETQPFAHLVTQKQQVSSFLRPQLVEQSEPKTPLNLKLVSTQIDLQSPQGISQLYSLSLPTLLNESDSSVYKEVKPTPSVIRAITHVSLPTLDQLINKQNPIIPPQPITMDSTTMLQYLSLSQCGIYSRNAVLGYIAQSLAHQPSNTPQQQQQPTPQQLSIIDHDNLYLYTNLINDLFNQIIGFELPSIDAFSNVLTPLLQLISSLPQAPQQSPQNYLHLYSPPQQRNVIPFVNLFNSHWSTLIGVIIGQPGNELNQSLQLLKSQYPQCSTLLENIDTIINSTSHPFGYQNAVNATAFGGNVNVFQQLHDVLMGTVNNNQDISTTQQHLYHIFSQITSPMITFNSKLYFDFIYPQIQAQGIQDEVLLGEITRICCSFYVQKSISQALLSLFTTILYINHSAQVLALNIAIQIGLGGQFIQFLTTSLNQNGQASNTFTQIPPTPRDDIDNHLNKLNQYQQLVQNSHLDSFISFPSLIDNLIQPHVDVNHDCLKQIKDQSNSSQQPQQPQPFAFWEMLSIALTQEPLAEGITLSQSPSDGVGMPLSIIHNHNKGIYNPLLCQHLGQFGISIGQQQQQQQQPPHIQEQQHQHQPQDQQVLQQQQPQDQQILQQQPQVMSSQQQQPQQPQPQQPIDMTPMQKPLQQPLPQSLPQSLPLTQSNVVGMLSPVKHSVQANPEQYQQPIQQQQSIQQPIQQQQQQIQQQQSYQQNPTPQVQPQPTQLPQRLPLTFPTNKASDMPLPQDQLSQTPQTSINSAGGLPSRSRYAINPLLGTDQAQQQQQQYGNDDFASNGSYSNVSQGYGGQNASYYGQQQQQQNNGYGNNVNGQYRGNNTGNDDNSQFGTAITNLTGISNTQELSAAAASMLKSTVSSVGSLSQGFMSMLGVQSTKKEANLSVGSDWYYDENLGRYVDRMNPGVNNDNNSAVVELPPTMESLQAQPSQQHYGQPVQQYQQEQQQQQQPQGYEQQFQQQYNQQGYSNNAYDQSQQYNQTQQYNQQQPQAQQGYSAQQYF